MTCTTEDIEARAEALLGGGTTDTEKTALSAVCAAARAELAARLREGVSPEDIGETFVTACGMLAVALCMESGSVGDVSAFSAGNVSVTRKTGETGVSAASLRKQAERMLAAYLTDSGFYFQGVRG